MADQPKPPVPAKDDAQLPSVTVLTDDQFEKLLEAWMQRELPQRVVPDAPTVTIDAGETRVTVPAWLKDVATDIGDPRYKTLVNLIDLGRAYSPSSYRLNAPPAAVVNQPDRLANT